MKIKTIKVGQLETNCYLLISGKELVVIDPGGEADKILRAIKESGARVKHIINTHRHFDHILANKELNKKTSAGILIGLRDGDEVRVGKIILKVIHTPGHAEESICLMSKDFIFTGDTLFKGCHGRTDLPGGSEEKMKASLKKLSKLIKPGMLVYPGHGPAFKI